MTTCFGLWCRKFSSHSRRSKINRNLILNRLKTQECILNSFISFVQLIGLHTAKLLSVFFCRRIKTQNGKYQKTKRAFIKLCNTYTNEITLTLKIYIFLWKCNDFPNTPGVTSQTLLIWFSTKAKKADFYKDVLKCRVL